jgi:hypothetical protein
MGPIFYYLKIWLELTLAYFYNPMAVGFMVIFLRMLAKFKLRGAFFLALFINIIAIFSFALLIALSGYETILSMRFEGQFFSYILLLAAWNLVVQSTLMALLSSWLHYHTRQLVLLTILSNIGAALGMIMLTKYHLII